MIKAIAFDLGGVFFAEGKSVALESMKKKYNYDPKIIKPLLSARLSQMATAIRRGDIEDEEFWSWVQSKLPAGYDAKIIKQEFYDGYILDKDICDLVKKLKEKYVLIVFSGNIRDRIDYLENKYNFRYLFDLEVYSFDCHTTKTDLGDLFYRKLIETANCEPAEILCIDDGDYVVEPLKKLGVNIILYSRGGIQNLLKELRDFEVNV